MSGTCRRSVSRGAEEAKTRRFEDVFNLLDDEDGLRTAHAHVRQHAGSRTAGCDGVVMRHFEENLEGNLQGLGKGLTAERCEPPPVRRTDIRAMNAGGRIQRRPLGIPAIRDRMGQAALRMILAPSGEADFSRHADGFRPHRSTKDAGADGGARWTSGQSLAAGWILAGDLQSCFDTIKHQTRMRRVPQRSRDKRILSVVWKVLRAAMMAQGNLRHARFGTPPGGRVRPLLANIYRQAGERDRERHTEIRKRTDVNAQDEEWRTSGRSVMRMMWWCDGTERRHKPRQGG